MYCQSVGNNFIKPKAVYNTAKYVYIHHQSPLPFYSIYFLISYMNSYFIYRIIIIARKYLIQLQFCHISYIFSS